MAVSVVLDQLTKYIAVEHLMPIGSHPFIPGFIEFSYTTNPGIAFGMLGGKGWFFIPVSFLAIILTVFFLIRFRKSISPLLSAAVAMVAGGGIGNQIDRIFKGEVVDFLNFQFIDFPVFNVADCFVTIGCVLAIIALIFFDRDLLSDDKKDKKPNDVSGEKEK